MFDVLKNTVLAGVGMGLMTVDKVEELARDMAKSAQLSTDKGEEFVKEAVERAKRGREDLEATVQNAVNDTVKRMNLPSREDITRLETRLAEVEKKLAEQAG